VETETQIKLEQILEFWARFISSLQQSKPEKHQQITDVMPA